MTKAELVQECVDRGFDYVASARISKAIDRAYQRICAWYPWSFLEEDATGSGEIEFSDLRRILSVTINEGEIKGLDRRTLLSMYPDLTEPGSATWWYLEGSTLKTFPADTATVTARYIKRPAELSDSDTPLVPSEWQYLIADDAIADLLKDDDEYAESRALRVDVKEGLREMVRALANPDLQSPSLIVRTGIPGVDYL